MIEDPVWAQWPIGKEGTAALTAHEGRELGEHEIKVVAITLGTALF